MTPARIAALLALVLGCSTPREVWRSSWDAPYSDFTDSARAGYHDARERSNAGDEEGAWRLLAPLAREYPDNIELGASLQELEIELVTRGTDCDPKLAVLSKESDPLAALMRAYAKRAGDDPTVANLVLAARIESDAIAAENLLERAVELDPDCAWAHYGRAHALLSQKKRDRWELARSALARALRLDPGHLAARRLEAWMLSHEGSSGDAAVALTDWLETTRDDPRVTSGERIAAQLDLATIWVIGGRPKPARRLLLSLEGTDVERARRLSLLAVCEHELGDLEAAIDVARRAEDAAGGRDLLPMVQQALIHEHFLDDPAAARVEWEQVIENARGEADLAALLQSLRARVMLERAEAREAAGGGE